MSLFARVVKARSSSVAVAGGVVIAMLGVFASGASANVYGIAVFHGANHHGTTMQIESDSMNVPNTNTDAIANDSWVINTNTSPVTFIEAAIAKGNVSYQGCSLILSRSSFFWADQRPNSSYFCHSGAVAAFGTYYTDTIFYAGGGTWNVSVGSLSGNSTSSLTSENQDNTGLEETTTGGTSCSHQRNLAWYDGANGLHSGWTDSEFGDATLSAANPPSVAWTNKPYALKDWSNASC